MDGQDVPGLEFEFQVTLKKVRRTVEVVPPETDPRPPVLTRALVLAHRIEAMVRGGKAKCYADAARILGVSGARVTQVHTLLFLSPVIQEEILDVSSERLATLSERQVRLIAATPDWGRQAALWARL